MVLNWVVIRKHVIGPVHDVVLHLYSWLERKTQGRGGIDNGRPSRDKCAKSIGLYARREPEMDAAAGILLIKRYSI